ncbi:hypothetical protein PoMZ_12437 [Pyricularia oryzae]|uniref:Uncharacterized protein n=1 Tax=Pyricularia oryzae TaxID=318829 RepID=A0A4P7NU93_PYROR|nr:hypothetical protein PoMZ_12437 [Pyricularia oryzae]
MGSFEEHYHTPLKSENYIRIFILSPSFKKAPIQCSLRELSLSKPEIKYEALSKNVQMGSVGKMCGKPYVLAFGIIYRLGIKGLKTNATPSLIWIFPKIPDQKTAAKLLKFFQRLWFFRIWTVQETATYGTAYWERISGSLNIWLTHTHSQNVMEIRIAASNLCSFKPVEISTLTAVLRYFPNLQYQVDHNKIFGFCTILKERLNLSDPNYTRPI